MGPGQCSHLLYRDSQYMRQDYFEKGALVSVDEGEGAKQVTIVKCWSEVVHLRHYLDARILLD
jgi:hypothetical protein